MNAVPSHLPLLARSLQQESGALTVGLPRLLTVADELPTLATGAEVADELTPRRPRERWEVVPVYFYFIFFYLFKTVHLGAEMHFKS